MIIQVTDTYTGKKGTMDDSEMSTRYQPIQNVQTTQGQTQQPIQQPAQQPSPNNIIGNILASVGRFIAPTTANAVQDVNASGQVGGYVNSMGQNTNDLIKNALVLRQANQSGNTQQAQQLAQQGRDIYNQPKPNEPQFSTDIGKSYLDRGVGIGGELGPLLAGLSPGLVGNKITSGLVTGALTGGVMGLTKPGQDLGQRLTSGAVGGVEGAAVGGALDFLGGLGKKTGELTTKAGNKLIQSQYNVPRSAGNALKISETIPELSRYGINNINDVIPAAEKVTGSDGLISKLTREAIGKSGGVDLDGVSAIAKQIASDPGIPPGQDTKLIKFFNKGLGEIGNQQPLEVFGYIQDLEKKAAGITKGRASYMIPAQDQALANAYSSMAGELKDRLYNNADKIAVNLVNKPEIMSQLSAISPKLAEDATKVSNLGELRSLAAPFVKGSQLSQITESGQNMATNNLGGVAKGVGKLVQNPLNLLAMPLSSDTVNAGAGGVLRAIGGKMGNVNLSGLSPILTNILVGDKSASTQSTQPTNQTQNNSNASGSSPQYNINTNNQNSQVNQPSSISQKGYGGLLGGRNLADLSQSEIANLSMSLPPALATRVVDAYNVAKFGSGPDQTNNVALQKSRTIANTALTSLENNFNQAGLAQGRIGGTISSLSAKAGLNPNLKTYESSRASVASLLAKAFGNVGNLSTTEQENAIKLLPTASSTPEEARQGFALIRTLLGLPQQ